MLYRIRARFETDFETNDFLYWSNDLGWVNKRSASVFSKAEKRELNLPIGGIWEEV